MSTYQQFYRALADAARISGQPSIFVGLMSSPTSAESQLTSDMSPEEFRRHGHAVIDWIADYLADPEKWPVIPGMKPGDLRKALPPSPPESGEPMEDILAELVGKIHGEVESQRFVMEKLAPGKWRVNGTMRLDDFRREYPPLGDVDDVETMGGLLVNLLNVVPNAGESATFRGLKLTAQVADDRRVRELFVEAVK